MTKKISTVKRKGARSIKEIPADVLEALNTGVLPSVNLVEWLAVDQRLLLQNVLQAQQRQQYLKPVLQRIENLKKQTVNTINETIGATLLELTRLNNDKDLQGIMVTHTSDVVRCWACYMVARTERYTLPQSLKKIQPFAADGHFGVREIAWLALRPRIAAALEESINLLAKWAANKDENIRRFASEVTRPRGVWCDHIESLKQQPEQALPILETLKADPAKYVQDSVGNWLNDASKSQPLFVKKLCAIWQKKSNVPATHYIVKKALRTLEKKS